MDVSDSTLLNNFANGADNRSFRLLVERYQDLVFSSALHRTSQRALAEEVAREVFLLLTEKSHFLKKHNTLAGWLHETSYKLASNKMKSEDRRAKRKQQNANDVYTQPSIG
jgi:RNA polymerase sigma-70 factor (ECF subfamily)